MESLPQLSVTHIHIDHLQVYKNNARTHSKKQIQKIADSIKEFGFNDPIAIDALNGIIAGHGRLEAAKLLGLKEVPTIQLGHLTRAQQKAYIIAHNRLALDAGWDMELLHIELKELEDAGFDISKTGFDDDEIQKILNPEIILESLQDADSEVSAPVIPVACRGDLWLLGNHRLYCGDSTEALHVEELMGELKPIIMITDPPYGVNYDPAWRDKAELGVGDRSRGKVENDHEMDWTDAYSLFTGDIAYVWHPAWYTADIATHLRNCNLEIVSQIIWVKQHFALSRGDYHWQHEPCWYAVKKGAKHNWQGARDQATIWNIKNNNAFGNATPEATHGHGTQKPIECMARPMLNNTYPNQVIYDPFGGSGTTLIAAEKYGRICLMMEIMPNYVDMIIKRWQDFTGKDAVLESTKQTYKDLSHERNTQHEGQA